MHFCIFLHHLNKIALVRQKQIKMDANKDDNYISNNLQLVWLHDLLALLQNQSKVELKAHKSQTRYDRIN